MRCKPLTLGDCVRAIHMRCLPHIGGPYATAHVAHDYDLFEIVRFFCFCFDEYSLRATNHFKQNHIREKWRTKESPDSAHWQRWRQNANIFSVHTKCS